MRTLKTLSLVALCLVSTLLTAQFKHAEVLGSISTGLLSTFDGTPTVPPIGVSVEYALDEKILIGPYIAYASSEDVNDAFGLRWRDNRTIFGLRGSYNFEVGDDFDLYGGVFVGYTFASTSILEGQSLLGGSFGAAAGGSYGIYGGARYLFDNKYGFSAELGYGISFATVGFVYNFGRHPIKGLKI